MWSVRLWITPSLIDASFWKCCEKKKIQKAYTLDADVVVIDLESTVPEDQKENAIKIIQDCKVNKQKTYIRINNNNDLARFENKI